MLTIKLKKYCGGSSCITSYVKFLKVCLDKDILEIVIIARADYRAEEINFQTTIVEKQHTIYFVCGDVENLEWEIDVYYDFM